MVPYLPPPPDIAEQWLAALEAAGGQLLYDHIDRLLPWLLDTYAPLPIQCLIHPSGLRPNLARIEDGAITTSVHLLITNPGEGDIARTLRVGDGVAMHDLYYLPPGLQGQGLGREMIRRAVLLYDQLGITQVRAECIDVGKYVWARCGFDFADHYEHMYVHEGMDDLAKRLGFREIPWMDHSWDYAATLGRDPGTGADTMVTLAELTDALGVPPLEAGGEASFPLGKALMRFGPKGKWRGVLDLTPGGEARQVLASYTGLQEA